MPDTVYVKRPVCPQDVARLAKDIGTFEECSWRQVSPVERERAVRDLGVSVEEMAEILSAIGGKKVTGNAVERWCSDAAEPESADNRLFRKFLTGFVRVGDIRALHREVALPGALAAQGSEDGSKAPRTRANAPKRAEEPANLSQALTAAGVE